MFFILARGRIVYPETRYLNLNQVSEFIKIDDNLIGFSDYKNCALLLLTNGEKRVSVFSYDNVIKELKTRNLL